MLNLNNEVFGFSLGNEKYQIPARVLQPNHLRRAALDAVCEGIAISGLSDSVRRFLLIDGTEHFVLICAYTGKEVVG